MEWKMLIDGKSEKPKPEQVVVGYWISGVESVACLCYYDEDCDEWITTDNGERIIEPDYWIATP